MLKGFLNRLGIGAAPDAPESGVSAADRKAFAADFACADAVESGLGEDIVRFILTGEGESVLLRIDAAAKSGTDKAEALHTALRATGYVPYGARFSQAEAERRHKSRVRILHGLESFDAAAMARFGKVLAASGFSVYGLGTDRSPPWLQHLFNQIQIFRHRVGVDRDSSGFLTARRVHAMLAAEGVPILALTDIVFGAGYYGSAFTKMPGLAELLEAEAEAVLAEIGSLPASARGNLLVFLSEAGAIDRVPGYFDFAFASTTAKAKVLCEPAVAALARADRARVESRAAAALGSAAVEERLAAVTVLAELLGAEALPRLDAHRANERAKPVLRLIDTLRPKLELAGSAAASTQADSAESYRAIDGSTVAAPPRVASENAIPPETADLLKALMEEANAAAKREHDDPNSARQWGRRGGFKRPHDPGAVADIVRLTKGEWPAGKPPPALGPVSYYPQAQEIYRRSLAALLERPDFGPKPLARLFAAYGHTPWGWALRSVLRGEGHHEPIASALSKRLASGADFRDVAEALEARGLPARTGVIALIESLSHSGSDDPEPVNPTVWPVLAAQSEAIDAALAERTARRRADAEAFACALCELYPKPPLRHLDLLIDAAAQSGRAARRRARALLAQAGDLTAVIEPRLQDGAAAKRAGAARWLGERRAASAIPVLRGALDREKSVEAKAAILGALAACGDDISDRFSEERLRDEAAREMPKLKVDHSAMIDPNALPALRWADGRAVDPAIVAYWFARAHKLKQPGGDPLLHMALERLDPDDAAGLGRQILSSFIQLDTRKATSDEANAYAQANAAQRQQAYQRWRKDYTYEQAFDELRREKLGEYLGSALDHRGLLALARFAPPAEAVAQVKRYLRDHGKRANQSRALLDTLAANPVPQVLQLLLDVSQRLKQPGSRKYAGELASRIAEERGWTAAEMADRTVPTLDLDERGGLDLAIGDKVFRLRLDDAARGELRLVIENPAGKVVASLPSPSDPAEAEAAKAAKKRVSTAKKELKQTVELQTRRLHEAMCVGRRWDAGDFSQLFAPHPILSRLLRRLVLSLHDADDAILGSARLLDDGSLTDSDDAPVALTGVASVGLAHRATLGEAASEAWRAHLADYEVAPLFPQIDRPLLPVPDGKASAIEDRQGWMLDNFTLRSACGKLGYAPGSVEDGGSYGAYEKAFPDLGLAAVIGFAGDFMGNTDKHAAPLHGLSFMRVKGGAKASGWGSEGIELAKVPPILLQEAWHDYHAVAAAGTGFDPEWRKKGL